MSYDFSQVTINAHVAVVCLPILSCLLSSSLDGSCASCRRSNRDFTKINFLVEKELVTAVIISKRRVFRKFGHWQMVCRSI